jgi:hypothetical protein
MYESFPILNVTKGALAPPPYVWTQSPLSSSCFFSDEWRS